MDKYQKQVQLELLAHEEDIRRKLATNYRAALKDVQIQLDKMMSRPDFDAKSTYYKYPKMMEAQLQGILYGLGEKNVADTEGYLKDVYKDAYLGCLYGMHQDGVGLILQADEKKVRKCVDRDTKGMKFSERLYKNVDNLKQAVMSELARGFSSGMDYESIARQIALRGKVSQGRARTLARTEGHRVENESKSQCMHDARSKGADVVKQWDSTLDNVTRDTHRELDGQVRELDEPFKILSTGAQAMYPGGFGLAREDINCRCCMLQRARWALEDEKEVTKWDGILKEPITIKAETFQDFKKAIMRYGMRIQLPPETDEVPGMTPEIKKEIEDAIDKLQNEYIIKLRDITVEKSDSAGDIFITGYYDADMYMVINSRRDFSLVAKVMQKKYDSGWFAGKTWEDYIAHEMFHVMLYQDCTSDNLHKSRQKYIQSLYAGYLTGISKYADKKKSANDALADAFVRMRNNEEVPLIVKTLVNSIIRRWKK